MTLDVGSRGRLSEGDRNLSATRDDLDGQDDPSKLLVDRQVLRAIAFDGGRFIGEAYETAARQHRPVPRTP